jgi:hypothetical protein
MTARHLTVAHQAHGECAWCDSRHAAIVAAVAHELAEQIRAETETRAVAAEARIQAITEATVMWRDRPGGDVGLAIALAGILDLEQPEPPASAALVRVLNECDRIERAVYGQRDEDDDGMREAVRRIRAAATEPLTRAAIDADREQR